MENINLKKHYSAFKWAISKNWKEKNGLYKSIQYKINVLVNQYNLTEREIIDELFRRYWERDHYQKFDPNKGSLNNWIARYVNLYLNHLIREQHVRSKDNPASKKDPLDHKNWAEITWIDKDNGRDDPEFQPELLIDTDNPESLLIAKETLNFVYGHFNQTEIEYLRGDLDLYHASVQAGITSEAFRKRVERRRLNFQDCIRLIERY